MQKGHIVDEKTLGILVMGSIVVALGAFGSFMHMRQQDQDEQRRKGQPRRLRPADRRAVQLRNR